MDQTEEKKLIVPDTLTPELLGKSLRFSAPQRRRLIAALISKDPDYWSDKHHNEGPFAEALLDYFRRPGGLQTYNKIACSVEKKKRPLAIGPAFYRSATDDLFQDQDFLAEWPSIRSDDNAPVEVIRYLIRHGELGRASNLAWAIASDFSDQIRDLCEEYPELATHVAPILVADTANGDSDGVLSKPEVPEEFDWPSGVKLCVKLVGQLSVDEVDRKLASDLTSAAASLQRYAEAQSQVDASRNRAKELFQRCSSVLTTFGIVISNKQAKAFLDSATADPEISAECDELLAKLTEAQEVHQNAKSEADPLDESSLDAWRQAAKIEQELKERLYACFPEPHARDLGDLQRSPEEISPPVGPKESSQDKVQPSTDAPTEVGLPEEDRAPSSESVSEPAEPASGQKMSLEPEHLEGQEPVHSPSYWLESHLRESRLREAYWLAWSLEHTGAEPEVPSVILGAAHAARFQAPGEPTGPDVRSLLESAMGLSLNPTASALASAAIVPVALFSPQPPEGAFTLASQLRTEVPELDSLVDEVRSACLHQGRYLNWAVIRETDLEVEFDARTRRIRADAEEYLNRVPHYSINWRPAADAFREAFREGQPMRRALKAVRDDNQREFPWVEQFYEDFSWDTALTETPTGRKFLHNIQGAARQRLQNLLTEFSSIIEEWVTLKNQRDELAKGQAHHALPSLRSSLLSRLSEVIASLSPLTRDPGIRGGVLSIVHNRMIELQQTLRDGELPPIEPLAAALLEFETVRLCPDLSPPECAEDIEALKHALQETRSEPDYATLIDVALTRGEFARAATLAERAGVDSLRARVDTEIQNGLDTARQRIEDAENDVEDAHLLGLLSEISRRSATKEGEAGPNRSELLARLQEAKQALAEDTQAPSPVDLGRALNTAIEVREVIRKLKKDRQNIFAEQLTAVVEELRQGNDEDIRDAIYLAEQGKHFIDDGDLIALTELVSQASAALQNRTRVDRFKTDALDRLEDYLAKSEQLGRFWNKAAMVAASIEKQDRVGPVSFGDKDLEYCRRAAAVVRSWDRLKVANLKGHSIPRESRDRILEVVQFLGFPADASADLGIASEEPNFLHLKLKISDAISISPIPSFGTGTYPVLDIVICAAKVQPRTLAEFLERKSLNRRAVLVLHRPELTVNQRFEFRGHASRLQLSALLVDFSLFLYVLASRDPMPVLLEVGLPFLWSQPYQKKGALVPKEMFVGRRQEVREVMEPEGTSVVYGGRQLGKSALLRHVRAEGHRPERGSFVVFVDIDNVGGPEAGEKVEAELWHQIGEELRHAAFLDVAAFEPRKRESRSEAVRRAIRERLGDNPSDRLIILLDEADDLLDTDAGQDFRLTKQIRELMDQTHHRCKVVFAGLQSVQRFYNYKNHPFAQLGSGVQIAPLPPAAARHLVIDPLRALGFEFSEHRLVYRILSHSNYHPGLVQIFCHRLLERLYREKGADRNPVRRIEWQDVVAIERDREFQREIRDRFDWTLDLDDRYKALVYALVISEDHEPTGALTETEFLDLGRFWWPQVFEDMDYQAARSLLDELVGLGVLAPEIDGDILRYRLRNPNLLRLLGPKPDLEAELSRLISREGTRRANPRHFRRLLDKSDALFSPLDSEQSAQLVRCERPLNVTVIRGSVPLGLSHVDPHIDQLFLELKGYGEEWERVHVPQRAISEGPSKIEALLTEKLKVQNRPHRYAIIDTSGLDRRFSVSSVIRGLIDSLSQTCRKKSRGLVVLLVDSAEIWRCLTDPDFPVILEDERVSQVNLKRWSDGAITKALEDLGLRTRAKDHGEFILRYTDGIHYLCQHVLRLAKNDKAATLTQEGLQRAIQELRNNSHLDVPTSFPALAATVTKLQALVMDRREDWQPAIDLLAESDGNETVPVIAERVLEDGGGRLRTWLRETGFIGPVRDRGDKSFRITSHLRAIP